MPSAGVCRQTPEDQNFEKHIEKQMGCMAGFLQIFDRHQRIYAAKRLPTSSPGAGSTSPSERSDISVASFTKEAVDAFPSSPENPTPAVEATPIPIKVAPVFDFKDGFRSSFKLKEGPRLSLDSRLRPRDIRTTQLNNNGCDAEAEAEADDKNRRSPSVVARLMGLDALPNDGEVDKKVELRRSASESRAQRGDQYRCFVEQLPLPPPFDTKVKPVSLPQQQPRRNTNVGSIQRKSFFDAQDFFPEPNRVGSRSIYGEIEKRLRMKGIDEPAKDLETLKQFLEALQLKGLLHSKPSDQQVNGRKNVVNERPIVIMKSNPNPIRRSGSPPRYVPAKRTVVEERRSRSRIPRSPPDPNPNSPTRRKPLNAARSPKAGLRKNTVPDPITVRSPKNGNVSSDCSISSSPQFDLEKSSSRMDYRTGRSLLERCDKLLDSIVAFTSAKQVTEMDQQPSPVSVLDSSFLGGDESSPSPVTKRSINFKDQLAEWEEDQWIETTPPADLPEADGRDFAYVSDIVRFSDNHADVYTLLEKHHNRTHSSKQAVLHRRLIFDTVAEILDRKCHVSPWVAFSCPKPQSDTPQLIREVWIEVGRIRKSGGDADDLNDVTCGVIRKDVMVGDHGWGDTSAEMSDAVLQIERLVFKDLIAETIRELADVVGNSRCCSLPRRKLVF